MTPLPVTRIRSTDVARPRRAGSWLTLCLGGMLCAAAGTAGAADLPSIASPPPPPPIFTAFSWTGAYAGLQAGYDWDHDHLVEFVTATGVPTGSVYRYGPDGFAGGAHIGFDYQIAAFVLGAVADFEGTTLRGAFLDPSGIGRGYDTLPWQGSVRGRLGYAFNNVLLYATGGFAYANLKNTYVFVPTDVHETFSRVTTGWTVGGGVDYALSQHWSTSVEYRYTEFGTYVNNSTSAFAGLSARQEFKANTVKVGLSYRF